MNSLFATLTGPGGVACSALLVLLCLGSPVRAADRQPAPAGKASGRTVSVMKQAHLTVSEKVTRTFNRIDNFFGNQRIEEEATGSRIRLNVLGDLEEGHGFSLKANFRAKIQLPQVDERLHLVISGDTEDDPQEDRAEAEDPEALQAETPVPTQDGVPDAVSLRYYHLDNLKWNLSSSAGVRGIIPPDPFVRVRARRSFIFGNWLLRLIASPFWRSRQGVGATAGINFDRQLSQRFSFRASTQGHWLADTDNLTASQRFLLYQSLSDRNSLEWQAGVFAETKPQQQVSSALLSLTFRRAVHQQWLYFELQPAVQFPRDEDFEAVASLSAKLEIIFGRPRDLPTERPES